MTPDMIFKTARRLASMMELRDTAEKNSPSHLLAQDRLNHMGGVLADAVGIEWYTVVSAVANNLLESGRA